MELESFRIVIHPFVFNDIKWEGIIMSTAVYFSVVAPCFVP